MRLNLPLGGITPLEGLLFYGGFMGDEETKEAQVTEDQPDEGFGDAFSEAVAGEAPPEKEEESTDDKAEVKGEEGEGEEAPPPKPGKSEEKVESPESLEQKYKTLQGMYNQLKEEKKEKPPAPEEKAPPPPDFSALFDNLDADLSDDIREELTNYEEEFDHISRFEGLKREQLAKRLIALMEASFQKLGEQLKPLYKTVGETAQSAHYATLKGAHDDFEQIRDSGALKEWIDSKPKIFQKALKDVYQNGETQDVIELFDTFKEETNYKKSVTKGKEKPSERGLEIVKTKEKGIPASQPQARQAKEDDFSAAFKEAASK